MKRGLLTFLCLAILSLASAPAGFMPARAGDGTLVLRICSGTNPRTIEIQVPKGQASDAEEEGEGCDYGTVSGFDAPALVEIALIAPSGRDLSGDLPAALTGIFPAALPPSTGPPHA